jgi:F0F1-type ATP synthase membrane subunit b/b'
MKNFLKKWREILTLGVFLILVGIFVYFLLIPVYKNIIIRRDQIQEELASQELQKKQLTEIPKIKQQYDWLKNEQEKLNVLLKKEDAVLLIEKLEKIANETNNKIKIEIVETKQLDKKSVAAPTEEVSKTATKDTPAKAIKTKEVDTTIIGNLPSKDYLEIKIGLVGDYNAMLAFLKKLEKMEYYNDIVSLQIKTYDEIKSLVNSQSSLVPSFSQTNNIDFENINNSSKKIETFFDTFFYLSK